MMSKRNRCGNGQRARDERGWQNIIEIRSHLIVGKKALWTANSRPVNRLLHLREFVTVFVMVFMMFVLLTVVFVMFVLLTVVLVNVFIVVAAAVVVNRRTGSAIGA